MFEGHRDQGRASDAMDSSEFKIGCRDLTNRVIHDGLWPVGIRPSIQADTSESQDILELAQSAFVASEVYGELIILVGVPESVVWEVV